MKDAGRLLRAYDDAAGVTAEFNRNVLRVVNRELGADFDVEEFEHVAIWDAEHEWIEMRLRSARAQQVTIARSRPDGLVRRRRGDAHRDLGQVPPRADRGRAGRRRACEMVRFWTDPDGDFGLTLAEPARAR